MFSNAANNADAKVEDELAQCLKNLDDLLKSTVMAAASMIPGFAGMAAATANVGFDLSKRFWVGAALSAASMIPLVGYLPGAAKLAWNVKRIDLELRKIEGLLPDVSGSPNLLSHVEKEATRHYEQIRHVPLARPLWSKLLRIIALCNGDAAELKNGDDARSLP